MPGPFPGMDPYLESPTRWQGVHNSLANGVMTFLNTILPDRYVAVLDLLEIDLLRSGLFTVAVAKDRLRHPHRHDYIACLYRSNPVEEYEVFPISRRDPLPPLKVPLGKGVPDDILEIQSVLDRVYDDGAYARRIDYNDEAEPPLADVDDLWAERLLREKGKR